MSDEETVICETHGVSDYGLLCCHLVNVNAGSGPAIEYFMANELDNEDTTDKECIWCKECDNLLLLEGSWSEKATEYASPEVVCVSCIESFKKNNIRGGLLK